MGTCKDKNTSTELRHRAEERLRAISTDLHRPRTGVEPQRLLHELQLHQIELEMQNIELRQGRDEMEKALGNYTEVYDFAPVGFFTLDRNGGISAANLSGASLVGIERARLIGRDFWPFVTDEARPLFFEFLGKVFADQGKVSCEVALLQEENSPLYAQIEAVVAASGQECRVAIIDISERRQSEEKREILHTDLAARSAELESANIELEAFNYCVSHDLRTPLTVVNGFCQLIPTLCGNTLDKQSKECIRKIYEATLRMNRLIDTLLDFSRVAHVEIRRETIDLTAMAKAVAAELGLVEPNRRVTFRISEGMMAVGDESLLRVVLDNLIGNAWKYTGDREETVIEFGMKEIEGRPAWFVRDNGPGFNMAHAENLFTPFRRIPGIDVVGHGIGLSTVERIVKRHGGRVWAESELGKGAAFLFTLE